MNLFLGFSRKRVSALTRICEAVMLNLCSVYLALTLSEIIMISAQSWTAVKRYPGWFVREVGFIDTLNESTVQDRVLCEWNCFNTLDCVGVAFNTTERSCLLITTKKKVFKQVQGGTMDTELIIVRSIDVCEAKLSNEEYAYSTVQEARDACNLIGLQLMTYSELDNVREEQYYSSCRCGFVDDGNQYFPMARIICVSGSVGMNNCSLPKANAYCRSAQ